MLLKTHKNFDKFEVLYVSVDDFRDLKKYIFYIFSKNSLDYDEIDIYVISTYL